MALTQLKALRKKHKMTQKELANALGIDKMFATDGACCRTKKSGLSCVISFEKTTKTGSFFESS